MYVSNVARALQQLVACSGGEFAFLIRNDDDDAMDLHQQEIRNVAAAVYYNTSPKAVDAGGVY